MQGLHSATPDEIPPLQYYNTRHRHCTHMSSSLYTHVIVTVHTCHRHCTHTHSRTPDGSCCWPHCTSIILSYNTIIIHYTLEHAQRRSHNSGEQREGVCLDENEHHEEDSRECTIHHPGVNGYTKQLRLCRGREGEGLAPAAYQ